MAEVKKRRVAAYCRVSTNLQIGGLESQIRAINLHFENNKIEGFDFYIDEGISGTKSSRPNLDRMMEAVRRGEISTVICYSFSRFARSVTHLLLALEEMNKFNCAFLSLTEKIETNSPMGKAFFVVIAAISQLERDILVERVKCGLENAKAKGVKLGRKKSRDSALIRKLFLTGVTYREIGRIAKCSSGAVSAEVRELKKELEDSQQLEKALQDRDYESVKVELEKTRSRVATLEGKVPDEEIFQKVVDLRKLA